MIPILFEGTQALEQDQNGTTLISWLVSRKNQDKRQRRDLDTPPLTLKMSEKERKGMIYANIEVSTAEPHNYASRPTSTEVEEGWGTPVSYTHLTLPTKA